MLHMLHQIAQEGTTQISHAYFGHVRKDEERKILAHADALEWEKVEPSLKAIFQQHLYQAIEGSPGEVNFPCMYTGDVLSVAKVASEEFDRTRNQPTVEVLETIRDMRSFNHDLMLQLGNTLAYKVLAAGAIKNHLVGVLRFAVVPRLGAEPLFFTFATLLDLDDREESLFDESKGKFITQELHNVIKRGSVSKHVLFPCLDEEGREIADMMVYAGSGAASWFKALEATRRLSPRREGEALVRLITEQTSVTEVPHDLFGRMELDLMEHAPEGLPAESVLDSVEKAVGYGVDRMGFKARWESTFGELAYRPTFHSLFGGDEVENPTRLKMRTGEIEINLAVSQLAQFRQVTVNGQTFILFAVPDRAKVNVGKDLDLRIKPVHLTDIQAWMLGDKG